METHLDVFGSISRPRPLLWSGLFLARVVAVING